MHQFYLVLFTIGVLILILGAFSAPIKNRLPVF